MIWISKHSLKLKSYPECTHSRTESVPFISSYSKREFTTQPRSSSAIPNSKLHAKIMAAISTLHFHWCVACWKKNPNVPYTAFITSSKGNLSSSLNLQFSTGSWRAFCYFFVWKVNVASIPSPNKPTQKRAHTPASKRKIKCNKFGFFKKVADSCK